MRDKGNDLRRKGNEEKRVAAALCAVTLAGAMIAGCGGNDTAGGNDSGDNGNNQESYTVKILAPK